MAVTATVSNHFKYIPWSDHEMNRKKHNKNLTYNVIRYSVLGMIETFKCNETEKIFNRQFSRKLPQDIQKIAFRKLRMLNRSSTIQDLRIPPANKLEALSGERKGQHSIRINDQWRICFKWKNRNAYDVEIVDYH